MLLQSKSEHSEQSQRDPLDLILDQAHGTTLVRNLFALVLNGKVDARGKPAKDPAAMQARELAKSIYIGFCDVLQGLKPIKDSVGLLSLSKVQAEIAKEMQCAIRTHFNRLPGLIVSKVLIFPCIFLNQHKMWVLKTVFLITFLYLISLCR